jgi:hypothetical protein
MGQKIVFNFTCTMSLLLKHFSHVFTLVIKLILNFYSSLPQLIIIISVIIIISIIVHFSYFTAG